jgi:hypothetical protein
VYFVPLSVLHLQAVQSKLGVYSGKVHLAVFDGVAQMGLGDTDVEYQSVRDYSVSYVV